LNPYDTCFANIEIDSTQFTLVWHVDNLKMSHKSNEVLGAEVKWLETIYGPLVDPRVINIRTWVGFDFYEHNAGGVNGTLHSEDD
jgi:hypothetical protein